MSLISGEQHSKPDYSMEAFYTRYGEYCGIDEATFQQMWETGEQLMPPVDSLVYGYHNAAHPQRALWDAMAICDRKESEDPTISINRRVLTLALLFHDVMYDTPVSRHGMDSKEAFSAYIMRFTAPDFGFIDDEIDFAEQIIMVTKLGTPPQTVEEEVMIEADIANIAEDYETRFKQSLLDLAGEEIYEKEQANGTFNDKEFCAKSIKVLCTYLSFLDPNSEFVQAATANVQRIIAEQFAPREHVTSAAYIQSLDSWPVNEVLSFTAA